MAPNGETRRIALIVDNPDRDLPGFVLVAMRLCADGATCCLVLFNRRVRELWALALDFGLMNHIAPQDGRSVKITPSSRP